MSSANPGSGKTAAFGFPALERVTRGHGIQLLILVPTRELCNQVSKEMQKFSKYKPMKIVEIYGGVAIGPQMHVLKFADIVVSTPGRLLDHLTRSTINLSKVKILVLDEADKMFEIGFIDDIKQIISQIPPNRQTLLFSATINQDVHDIAQNYMRNPMKVKMQSYVDKSKLIQHYYQVDSRDKFSLLVHLLTAEKCALCIVFCATRSRVDDLNSNLMKQFKSQALHGGLSQNRRNAVMDMFHNHKLDVLIASDVAARGLDIKDVGLIVNYDIPKTSKDYVHRIGRTARAGSEGKVISLLAPQDHENFSNVLQDRSLLVHECPIPQFQRIPFMRHSFQQQRGRFPQRGQHGGGFGSRSGFGGRSSSGGGRPRRY